MSLTHFKIVNENNNEDIRYLTEKDIELLDKNYSTASPFNDNNKYGKMKLFNSLIKYNMGSFYFNFCESLSKYDGAMLFRFLYLSTFMNYKGYLQYGNSSKQSYNSLIVKKNIQEILKLKDALYFKTVKYFEENNMIKYDDNNRVYINCKICIRGELSNMNKKKDKIRMFDKQIKELYENSKPSEHKNIILLFKLIPFINKETGLVVYNPEENDIGLLKPMTRKDILEVLNLNNSRTISNLLNLKILKGTESAFAKISNAFIKNAYMINPRIAYSGTDINNLELILNEFLPCFKICNKIK